MKLSNQSSKGDINKIKRFNASFIVVLALLVISCCFFDMFVMQKNDADILTKRHWKFFIGLMTCATYIVVYLYQGIFCCWSKKVIWTWTFLLNQHTNLINAVWHYVLIKNSFLRSYMSIEMNVNDNSKRIILQKWN